jgi:hypothetical protein
MEENSVAKHRPTCCLRVSDLVVLPSPFSLPFYLLTTIVATLQMKQNFGDCEYPYNMLFWPLFTVTQ